MMERNHRRDAMFVADSRLPHGISKQLTGMNGRAFLMTASTLAMLQRWQDYEQGQQSFDLSAEMMRLTLQIVTKTLFSVDFEAEASLVGQAFTTALEHLNRDLNALVPLPLWIPTPNASCQNN